MATSMLTGHYVAQPNAHYGYAAPPSPPLDETSKCSLPSISNLLGLADQGSPTSETSPQSQSPSQTQQQQQQQQQEQQQQHQHQQPQHVQQQQQIQQQQQQTLHQQLLQQQTQIARPDTRPNSSHYNSVQIPRSVLPPTPPMSSDASFDGYNSPSTRSVSQLSVASGYYFESTPPPMSQVETDPRHHMSTGLSRLPMQASSYQPQFAAAAASYLAQPTMSSYYPPMQPTPPPQPQISSLYYQRPLPQTFPPLPVSVALAPTSGANPWQHHHYISPSSAASFPQSQDRYICQTCNKAFSRPSSLRIHTHSHTGEKPFKCPHAGCGKAFSVRSNMKRHERGCHSFESSSGGSALLS
ncbi:hypothetical protein VTK73DRAFT_5359 [Phialemonium thermophilum]|uniref:C2H2-type domain-containing protein n=1 Tax=Phialemonium thermophilum TaxID=223376 RepID=A0ABR3Y831_9PEZI